MKSQILLKGFKGNGFIQLVTRPKSQRVDEAARGLFRFNGIKGDYLSEEAAELDQSTF